MLYRFEYGQAIAQPNEIPGIPPAVVVQAGRVLGRPSVDTRLPAASASSRGGSQKRPRERSVSVAPQRKSRGRSISVRPRGASEPPRGTSEKPKKRRKLEGAVPKPVPKLEFKKHASFLRFKKVVPGSAEARDWLNSLREHGKPLGGWDEDSADEDMAGEENKEHEGKILSRPKDMAYLVTFLKAMFVSLWCDVLGKFFLYLNHNAYICLSLMCSW